MRRLLFPPLFLALSLLTACAHDRQGPTPSLDLAPAADRVNCQPTVRAASEAEPAPPAGLTRENFYNPMLDWVMDTLGPEDGKAWWEWFSTTYPKWAREGWIRIDKARAEPPCT